MYIYNSIHIYLSIYLSISISLYLSHSFHISLSSIYLSSTYPSADIVQSVLGSHLSKDETQNPFRGFMLIFFSIPFPGSSKMILNMLTNPTPVTLIAYLKFSVVS